MLTLKNITKQYFINERSPQKASMFRLEVNHLTIDEGVIFSLLGPSGCGKTTLLKLVAGLLPPDTGDVDFRSKRLTNRPPEKRDFAMVFQEPLLFPHKTVWENAAFGLKMKGMKKAERREKTEALLSDMGLRGLEHRWPSELSGGQKQRVSLARAVAVEPRFMLMDEPFSSLDDALRKEMRALVLELKNRYNITVLFVTHDREEAFAMSDRMGIMKDGHILQTGQPRELYERPRHPFVARFLGADNVLKGHVDNQVFHSRQRCIPLASTYSEVKGEGWLVLRPETITQEADFGGTDPWLHRFRGTVRQMTYTQGFYHLRVQWGDDILSVIQPAGHRTKQLAEGQTATFVFDVRQAHFTNIDH